MEESERAQPMTRPSSYLALAEQFESGESSPSRELEDRLTRLDAVEDTLMAFVHVGLDAARRGAAESDARWKEGKPLSPIDGMAIGVKDIIETADMPTGQGSPMWEGFESRRDAASVQALREAGALILGKTTTTEFATAYTLAPTTNPVDPTRTPGGSSSGSAAAVGAGVLPAALGTQVVGSILRPASFCGVVGFKPSVGALNRGGSYDYLSQSCLGVLGATPNDVWIVAIAIAKRVGGDPGFIGLQGPELPPRPQTPRRLAVLQTAAWPKVGEGARNAFAKARRRLEALGVELIDRENDPDVEALEQSIVDCQTRTMAINAWESAWPLGAYAMTNAEALSSLALDRLERARSMTVDEYRELLELREHSRKCHAAVGEQHDGLVLLGALGAAPVGLGSTGDPAINAPASWLGGPAITLPLMNDGGLPLGLQLIGSLDHDAGLVARADWVWQNF